MRLSVRNFLLILCFGLLVSEVFHAPLQAQTGMPWPSAEALVEEYQNLKLQSELYMAMDPEVAQEIPELRDLEARMKEKLSQIRAHSQGLNGSPEGKALLNLSRKIQAIQALRNKLSECYQSRKGQEATRSIVQALIDQPDDCAPFSSDSHLTKILSALAAPASTVPSEHQDQQSELLNSLFYNTVLQSAQRYGELTYLVTDIAPADSSFFDQLCGQEAWCDRLSASADLPDGQSLKTQLDQQVRQQHQRMGAQNTPRRTTAQVGRMVKCHLVGCDGSPGLFESIDRGFSSQLALPQDVLSFSLDLLEQQGGTLLQLAGVPTTTHGSDPEDLQFALEAEDQWAEGIEQQAQRLISEHIGLFESDPLLQILSARKDVSGTLCIGGCRAQVARSTVSGAMELTFINSQNLSPLTDDLLQQLHHRPDTALKGTLKSTQEMLTEGLASIGRDLFPSTPLSPERLQRNLGRLIGGNPMAAAQTLLARPELINSLCSAIMAMEDDNPWVDVLIVAGGVGAVVAGGLIAGPVGLAVASAAVGLGSAAYGVNQYREHSSMARHYQVACYNEVDPLSSELCRQYHRESVMAQMNLLGAGVDVLTLGSLSTYRRMVQQAVSASSSLGRSLSTLRSMPAMLNEVSSVMGDSTARLLNRTLASSTVAQREEFLSLYQRAKTYLNQEDFHASLRESVRRACGPTSVR